MCNCWYNWLYKWNKMKLNFYFYFIKINLKDNFLKIIEKFLRKFKI